MKFRNGYYRIMNKVEDGQGGGGGSAPEGQEVETKVEGQETPVGEEAPAPKEDNSEELQSELIKVKEELAAMRKEKEEAAALKAQEEAKSKEDKKKDLEDKEDWKALFLLQKEEAEEAEAKKREAEEEAAALKQEEMKKTLEELKLNAALNELKSRGLSFKNDKLVDLVKEQIIKEVLVNPDSGAIEAKSTTKVVDSIVAEHGEYAFNNKEIKNLPAGGRKTPKMEADKKDVKKMSDQEFREYLRNQAKA